jgi:hypothetical protein
MFTLSTPVPAKFIAPGEFVSRPRANAARLGNVVKFSWEMVPTSGGEPAGVGLEILVLDDDGRIRMDYMFIEA